MFDEQLLKSLLAAEKHLHGDSNLPEVPTRDRSDLDSILIETADRLRDNDPYAHPFYLGQMLKPPHPIAASAYALAMSVNPNNHALDGGRASSEMEKECVQQLGAMFNWENPLGHLCSGGTIANFEALWVAREMAPDKAIVSSAHAHYTHSRLSSVLGVPHRSIPVDSTGRISIDGLKRELDQGDIGTVVVTMGTTGLGAVDPLTEVLKLREQYSFRIHADAAYGGYYRLTSKLDSQTEAEFTAITEADSIVIDPHKHGLQPYGCGCVLFRDWSAMSVYKHASPYTYYSSDDLHLGEISLECSRAGAAAVALWATMKRFPLQPGGEFAERLQCSLTAARQLHSWIDQQPKLTAIQSPELDIVCWAINANTSAKSSSLARQFFEQAAQQDLSLALIHLDRSFIEERGIIKEWDTDQLCCLRSVLMKPEHLEWMPKILERLNRVSIP